MKTAESRVLESKMKELGLVLALLLTVAPAYGAPPGYSDGDNRFTGTWRSLDSDSRKFRIEQNRFG
jgi:hypothetical protein